MYTDNKLRTIQPSHWINAGYYTISIIGTLFFHWACILLLVVKYLELDTWKYELNERTIIERKGILSVTRREIHYYRIKSIKIDEPLWMRTFGLANVSIMTSDPYYPEMILTAVPNGVLIREQLRDFTDKWRKEEGVREFDMYNLK